MIFFLRHHSHVLLAGFIVLGISALAPNSAEAQITEIIDPTGDNTGNALITPWGVTTDGAGNAYVAGFFSDNAFKITPLGGISAIIDSTGDGKGNALVHAAGIEADDTGSVFVTGLDSDNLFKIAPDGQITELVNITGDGEGHLLDGPWGVVVGGAGHLHTAGGESDNVFRVFDGVFADGFETGTTANWSAWVPDVMSRPVS